MNETTLELVNFSEIIIKIQLNDFNCYLPTNICKIIKDEASPSKRGTTQENTKNKK